MTCMLTGFGYLVLDLQSNQEYCVKTVSPALPGPQVPLGLGDDFVAILNRVMPNFRDQPILSEISATVGKGSGATALFKGERLELKPHAEAIILDHFFTNNINIFFRKGVYNFERIQKISIFFDFLVYFDIIFFFKSNLNYTLNI